MSSWSPWDWISYTILFISAIIIAIIQGGKDITSPSFIPDFFLIINWNYIPLILIVIATTIFISKEFGWIDKKNLNVTIFPNVYEYKIVKNENFMNESVVLDGHRYERCRFVNVTFIWNGSAPFELINCDREGAFRLTSKNDAINSTLLLLEGFKFLGNISNNPNLHDLLRIDIQKSKQ